MDDGVYNQASIMIGSHDISSGYSQDKGDNKDSEDIEKTIDNDLIDKFKYIRAALNNNSLTAIECMEYINEGEIDSVKLNLAMREIFGTDIPLTENILKIRGLMELEKQILSKKALVEKEQIELALLCAQYAAIFSQPIMSKQELQTGGVIPVDNAYMVINNKIKLNNKGFGLSDQENAEMGR